MVTEREGRPKESEFPHDTMAADHCQAGRVDPSADDGMLVCHLLEGHAGDHWDDWDARWWTNGGSERD